MPRRTVELGAVTVEGLRLSGDRHLVLFRIDGKAVELPVSPSLLPVVKDLYGERARLALVVEDFDPKAKDWKETSRQFYQVNEETGPRAKPEAKKMSKVREQLASDHKLLAEALRLVGGKKARVGTAMGSSRAAYFALVDRLQANRPLTDNMRGKLEKLVQRLGPAVESG